MRLGYFPIMAGRMAGGPETYEVSLLPELARVAPNNEYHAYCLSDAAVEAFGKLPDNVQLHRLAPSNRLISIPLTLPMRLKLDAIELLHVTFTPPPLSPPPYVFTMHDVSMFDTPEYYPSTVRYRLTRLIERGLRQCAVVLCVSEHCKTTVAERFGIGEDRLFVAHHGVSPIYHRIDRTQAIAHVRDRFGIDSPFLLYVGKYEKRKNLPLLIAAYDQFRRQVDDPPLLVLAGKRAWLADEISAEIARRQLETHVVELDYVATNDLPYLHNAAEMLVFPSLWEGFGLPIIEAMACGLPVVTSNVTCLPEVAGDAAMMVDPGNAEKVAAAIYEVHTDDSLRTTLIRKGLERASQFTWRKCAESSLEAYSAANSLRDR